MSQSRKPLIHVEDAYFSYQKEGDAPSYALDGISLKIHEGEYVAIVGANGSGKSTLLRHMNALLTPARGDVYIAGWNTKDEAHIRDIRSTVGMVFQVPETQIVATVVEEDVAFGPENLGISSNELSERVKWALETVGLTDLRNRPSHLLSGGQKQLLAIASTLSMKPKCLVLDEATSMLDPLSRAHLLETISLLHSRGMSIVTATHNMDEASKAQRIVVLSEGRVITSGDSGSVFTHETMLKKLKLELPSTVKLAKKLSQFFDHFPTTILSPDELVSAIVKTLLLEGQVNETK